MSILGWVVIGVVVVIFLNLFALYRRGVTERNHLSCYIGMLLLDDSLRAAHKQSLERFILESKETNAPALSGRALIAIDRMANDLASRDRKLPSVLLFNAMAWDEKKALRKEPCETQKRARFPDAPNRAVNVTTASDSG